jgi:hypothetical protein
MAVPCCGMFGDRLAGAVGSSRHLDRVGFAVRFTDAITSGEVDFIQHDDHAWSFRVLIEDPSGDVTLIGNMIRFSSKELAQNSAWEAIRKQTRKRLDRQTLQRLRRYTISHDLVLPPN